jgi:UDP-N-acetylglucosamine 2-epimerase (hydrolysing)
MNKKILYLTGTRADFGKLKSLIEKTSKTDFFETYIFATGMHLQKKYGYTVEEIEKCGYKNIYKFINHTSETTMDQTLAKTIQGFSNYVCELKPDLIVVHGDRVEALAGAIVGSLNNILVAHIEGGEVSGTIDELIRHSVSKLSHIHFVSNDIAKKRLTQMGEIENNIFVIGSPDVDVMLSNNLPSYENAKKRYDIDFDEYGVVMFHPVTTEIENISKYSRQLVDALLKQSCNLIVIYPNNDLGSSSILNEYKRLLERKNIRIFPSLRFEYFLVLLKYSRFILGNSSAGIREAPYYGLPTINIGTRQNNRALNLEIINCDYETSSIISAINKALNAKFSKISSFGIGNSDEQFINCLLSTEFWQISKQKVFKDIVFTDI